MLKASLRTFRKWYCSLFTTNCFGDIILVVLVANMLWVIAQTPINRIKKWTFLESLRKVTCKLDKWPRIFSSIFSALTVCNIYFWIWKDTKLIFMWSSFWFILVGKISQFLAKGYQPIRTPHHTPIENRHPKVTKIHTMICLPRSATKIISSWIISD